MEEEILETNTLINDTRLDEIAYNTAVIKNSVLLLISLVIVIFVCFILYKAVDNFISY